MQNHKTIIVGLMSGTSLDGLDIACCEFNANGNKYQYHIIEAETFAYSEKWSERLKQAHKLSGFELIQLHKTYGEYIGKRVSAFLKEKDISPEYIASHGHTIFHDPEKKITFQLGDGAAIAAAARITTISDFRSLDVALGGQGAPLVPIGDQFLFGDYDYCLNLGGFANVSYDQKGVRIAYDICPVNLAINHIANKLGFLFDENGTIAQRGSVNNDLLKDLNRMVFYQQQPPKSLGREWLEEHFLPIVDSSSCSDYDKMRTIYEHVVVQLKKQFLPTSGVLITGGGAKNLFLMKLLEDASEAHLTIPEKTLIDFKEAIIFAFLGLLRWQDKANCLASVTGAEFDNIGGIIHKI